MKHLKYLLPVVYSKILPRKLLEQNIIETKANCDNCYRASSFYRGKYPYQAHLKCCTFEPYLPNFLVGAILLENENSSVVKHKILKRQFALPIGIVPQLNYQIKFNQRKKEQFGQDPELLCSYYDRELNRCSIWRNRGVVCTTFYCISDQGVEGQKFWKNLNHYLSYIEMALMEECLARLDFSPRQVSGLLGYINRKEAYAGESLVHLPTKKSIELWNGYFDQQEDFFKKCHQIVTSLSPKEFQELLGPMGQKLEESVSF